MGKSAIESIDFPSQDLAIKITPNASKWRQLYAEVYGRKPHPGNPVKFEAEVLSRIAWYLVLVLLGGKLPGVEEAPKLALRS